MTKPTIIVLVMIGLATGCATIDRVERVENHSVMVQNAMHRNYDNLDERISKLEDWAAGLLAYSQNGSTLTIHIPPGLNGIERDQLMLQATAYYKP